MREAMFVPAAEARGQWDIHDNGGRPFRVSAGGVMGMLTVHTYKKFEGDETRYNKMLLSLTAGSWLGLFTGHDPDKGAHGNNLLVKLGPTHWLHIGDKPSVFHTTENIRYFLSPLGNSDVPYPLAFSEERVFFLSARNEVASVAKSEFKVPVDPEHLTKDDIWALWSAYFDGPDKDLAKKQMHSSLRALPSPVRDYSFESYVSEEHAKQIVAGILKDLRGRRGLRQEFDQIDKQVMQELEESLVKIAGQHFHGE